jgi:mannose-6-phosphate isomerase-like protein (cupin superfamily)
MIRSGQTLVNDATGESLTFVRTSADTDGQLVELECIVAPGGQVAAAHVHPRQEERFDVREGVLGLKVGRETRELIAGELAVVAPGTPHRFWNAGDGPLRFRCEVRPALAFESLIETMFALAADGKTNRKGLPNPVRMAAVARHHREVIRLAGVPAWLQDLGTALAMPLAAVCRYGGTYEPAGAPAYA